MVELRTYFDLGKTREINLLYYARLTLTNSACAGKASLGTASPATAARFRQDERDYSASAVILIMKQTERRHQHRYLATYSLAFRFSDEILFISDILILCFCPWPW